MKIPQVKSATEKEFDAWDERYYKRFGKNYGIIYGDPRSLKEHIAIMKKCIKDGTPYVYEPHEYVLHMDDVI